ncbi:MAG: OmpP1/FadL family transporter [Bacteroidales bacterium]
MKRTILIILMGIISIGYAHTQNEADALRYSQRFFGSTARSVGMGGAFASLGGDFSSLGYNPAGIGVFRTTELTFSPSFTMDEISSRYMDETRTDTEYSFGLNNLGLIASFNKDRESGWVGTNFGIGYNRHNNFNRNQVIEGVNPNSSMADFFLDGPYGANGSYPEQLEPFWERLAFDTYVIDTVPGSPTWYETPVMLGQTQREIISASGHTGEWLFSFGANFEHKFYLGATFGIENVDYTRNSNYTETDDQDLGYFEQFRFSRNLNTSGTGYTFKAGAIYTPVKLLRIGASFHLPTFYNLTDEYHHEMESWFDNGDYYSAVPTNANGNPIGNRVKDYSLTTPFRAIGGIGLMLPGQFGVISFDYEYVDYTTMKIRETDGGYDFYDENLAIQNVYRPTGNIKAGAELRFGQFLIRGGYALYGSPYASGQLNEDAGYTSYSGGFGFRDSNFFIDLGYVTTRQQEKYLLYEYPDMEPAVGESTNNRFLLTVGFRF